MVSETHASFTYTKRALSHSVTCAMCCYTYYISLFLLPLSLGCAGGDLTEAGFKVVISGPTGSTGGVSFITAENVNLPITVTPVAGGWCDWSAFGSCTSDDGCNFGLESRTRECACPSAVGTGATCTGSAAEDQSCFQGLCCTTCSKKTTTTTSKLTLPVPMTHAINPITMIFLILPRLRVCPQL